MDYLKNLDFFSQSFNFYLANQQTKKGTFQGAFISLSILAIVISYFIYLILQFANNQIDPKFRSQVFVTDEATQISLQDDLMAFQFQKSIKVSLDEFQSQMNQTYLVPVAYFVQMNKTNSTVIQLNITECQNAQLQDYKCLDFSTLSNYSLILYGKESIQSFIYLLYYPCQVTDNFKRSVPDNCANQADIEDFVNGQSSGLNIKLFTSQYNITSKQSQTNFMDKFIYTDSNQYQFSTVYTQQQVTKISQGLVIQSESQISGPIYYNIQNNAFSNEFNSPYIQSTNAQENTNQAEQNLQEKEISDKIQLPEFTSKFRDYLEQSSQVQESPLKLYNQMDEVLESQKDSTSCGFNLTSIEQTNENINTLQDKSTIFNKNKIISSSENQKQQKSSQSDQKYQNYLEEQQNILNSCDLKCKYINKFLKNSSCANNNNDDDVNSRILSSISYKNI
ncbi:hypothetical protein ABPG74_011430 [Tetrahymena malaccensis]